MHGGCPYDGPYPPGCPPPPPPPPGPPCAPGPGAGAPLDGCPQMPPDALPPPDGVMLTPPEQGTFTSYLHRPLPFLPLQVVFITDSKSYLATHFRSPRRVPHVRRGGAGSRSRSRSRAPSAAADGPRHGGLGGGNGALHHHQPGRVVGRGQQRRRQLLVTRQKPGSNHALKSVRASCFLPVEGEEVM